ncbi:ABC transporter ATP-binding protein [Salinispira pacifica]|uniref:Methionine ABC transporter ATP-binding protein n=1 Tax=Salinispira pacifica TaxID=1307761 RepID=V5WKF8_9SPIO|nr:ATP-binding cassette domain-containing protein [Salinispira pacifica]AHC16024.1 Methionine ABC transporter ATP-binding protein [Salinispira pacifica]
MIQISHLSKVFNPGTADEHTAIHNLNLDVREGDFITIIGSNGAGKSTLFNLISGTLPPSRGTLQLGERDITRLAEHRRAKYIGRIFQNPTMGTAGNMTLEDNMMIASTKGFKGLKISLNEKRREYFRSQLKRLDMGLEHRLKENVELLSGGQRQSVTLLMMVLSQPRLILLDEHTAALDPRNAAKIQDLTRQFVSEFGLTCMMITHNMQHAIDHGNRLLMMDRGRIVLDVDGEEKKRLTVAGLVERFHAVTGTEFARDDALLGE